MEKENFITQERLIAEREAAYTKIVNLTLGQSLHKYFNEYDCKIRIECGLNAWYNFQHFHGHFTLQAEFGTAAHEWLSNIESWPLELFKLQYENRLVNHSLYDNDEAAIQFFFSLYQPPQAKITGEILLQEAFLSGFIHLVHQGDYVKSLSPVLKLLEETKIKEFPRFMGAMRRREAEELLAREQDADPTKLHYLLRLTEARSELPWQCQANSINLILSTSRSVPIVVNQTGYQQARSSFTSVKDKTIPVHLEKHIHLISCNDKEAKPCFVNRLGHMQDNNLDFLAQDLKFFANDREWNFDFDARYNFPVLSNFEGSLSRPILSKDEAPVVAPIPSTILHIFEGANNYPYEIHPYIEGKDSQTQGRYSSKQWWTNMSVRQLKPLLCAKYGDNFTIYQDCIISHDYSLHDGRALDDYDFDHTKPGIYRLQIVNCYDRKRLPKHPIIPWSNGHIKYYISANCASLRDAIQSAMKFVNGNFPNLILEEVINKNHQDIVIIDCLESKDDKVWTDVGHHPEIKKNNQIMLHSSCSSDDIAHLFLHTCGWHHSDGEYKNCCYFTPYDTLDGDHSLRRYGWNIEEKLQSYNRLLSNEELKRDLDYLYLPIQISCCSEKNPYTSFKQAWYQCETCWGSGKLVQLVCCGTCASTCHMGHRLIKIERPSENKCLCGIQRHKQCCTAQTDGNSQVQIMSYCVTCKKMYCKSCIMTCHSTHVLDHSRAAMVKGRCPCHETHHLKSSVRCSTNLSLRINPTAPLQYINDYSSTCLLM